MSHTPGPWRLDPTGRWILPPLDDDPPIAEAYRVNTETAANARLIAAAPELLEVAAEALERLDFIVITSPERSNTAAFRERLRAVVARATGELEA